MMEVSLRCLFAVLFFMMMVSGGSAFAEQLRFRDWVGIQEPDPLTNQQSKKIGTFASDGVSSLWLSDTGSDAEMVQLTLESKKAMASEYFSYRIDRVDTLTIRSAIKGCESNCLTDEVSKKGELIKMMKRGLQIKFEYDSYPDIAQNPTFSLRGFSRAYNWLLSK
jgi:invasion protein IalB